MAQQQYGHRRSIGTDAVIRFRANDELVGRVIALKLKRAREELQRHVSIR